MRPHEMRFQRMPLFRKGNSLFPQVLKILTLTLQPSIPSHQVPPGGHPILNATCIPPYRHQLFSPAGADNSHRKQVTRLLRHHLVSDQSAVDINSLIQI
jgi:hypothetical protein